jgi:hypothetical protein
MWPLAAKYKMAGRGQTDDSITYSVEPFGLEDVSIDTVELPPASRAPSVDTPCNTKRAHDIQLTHQQTTTQQEQSDRNSHSQLFLLVLYCLQS